MIIFKNINQNLSNFEMISYQSKREFKDHFCEEFNRWRSKEDYYKEIDCFKFILIQKIVNNCANWQAKLKEDIKNPQFLFLESNTPYNEILKSVIALSDKNKLTDKVKLLLFPAIFKISKEKSLNDTSLSQDISENINSLKLNDLIDLYYLYPQIEIQKHNL